MTPSFLSGPHEFSDFNGILTIVPASFSCQDNDLGLTGIIAPDGQIEQVAALLVKVEAAARAQLKTTVVPRG
jgi:predicted S18 family serine protease